MRGLNETVRRDASFLRSERLKQIKLWIAQGIKDGVDLPKLLDLIEIEMGLRRETAFEYIQLVVRTSGWVIDGNVIKFEG